MAKNILLLCGGQSEEHEVSLASAKSVFKATKKYFEVKPIVITKTGQLLSKADSTKALTDGTSKELSSDTNLQSLNKENFDVVFPLLHGPNGEDGSIQGMLELLAIPYVGSGVLGSAVGMDKIMMKAVYKAHGLPQIPYITLSRAEWKKDPQQELAKLESLVYPLFVKPANLGSSVGISKVRNSKELSSAIDEAGQLDRRIIVEQGLASPRELEVAVLGNDDPKASVVGEISFNADFYDYSTKYTAGLADLTIPAHIPEHVAFECQALAIEAFQAVDAAGLARVDFFYDELNDQLYLNEINTMPGFTQTSMYPRLWEATGLPYEELVRVLIELALEER